MLESRCANTDLGVGQVVHNAPRRAHNNVRPLSQRNGLQMQKHMFRPLRSLPRSMTSTPVHHHNPVMNLDARDRQAEEMPHLRHHVNAADQHRALDLDPRAQRLELLSDLDGQLARGRQHEREKCLRLVQQLLQDGQRKGARLAGPRLRQADDIAACKITQQTTSSTLITQGNVDFAERVWMTVQHLCTWWCR